MVELRLRRALLLDPSETTGGGSHPQRNRLWEQGYAIASDATIRRAIEG